MALAYRGIPLQAPYCAAKHAIQGFDDSLRADLHHAGSRIRVNSVHLPALNTTQFTWVRTRLPRHPSRSGRSASPTTGTTPAPTGRSTAGPGATAPSSGRLPPPQLAAGLAGAGPAGRPPDSRPLVTGTRVAGSPRATDTRRTCCGSATARGRGHGRGHPPGS